MRMNDNHHAFISCMHAGRHWLRWIALEWNGYTLTLLVSSLDIKGFPHSGGDGAPMRLLPALFFLCGKRSKWLNAFIICWWLCSLDIVCSSSIRSLEQLIWNHLGIHPFNFTSATLSAFWKWVIWDQRHGSVLCNNGITLFTSFPLFIIIILVHWSVSQID